MSTDRRTTPAASETFRKWRCRLNERGRRHYKRVKNGVDPHARLGTVLCARAGGAELRVLWDGTKGPQYVDRRLVDEVEDGVLPDGYYWVRPGSSYSDWKPARWHSADKVWQTVGHSGYMPECWVAVVGPPLTSPPP